MFFLLSFGFDYLPYSVESPTLNLQIILNIESVVKHKDLGQLPLKALS